MDPTGAHLNPVLSDSLCTYVCSTRRSGVCDLARVFPSSTVKIWTHGTNFSRLSVAAAFINTVLLYFKRDSQSACTLLQCEAFFTLCNNLN